jgi:hypothetical protein
MTSVHLIRSPRSRMAMTETYASKGATQLQYVASFQYRFTLRARQRGTHLHNYTNRNFLNKLNKLYLQTNMAWFQQPVFKANTHCSW